MNRQKIEMGVIAAVFISAVLATWYFNPTTDFNPNNEPCIGVQYGICENDGFLSYTDDRPERELWYCRRCYRNLPYHYQQKIEEQRYAKSN